MNIQTIAAVRMMHGMIRVGRSFGLSRILELSAVSVLILLVASPLSASGVPSTITIQGRLTDATNVIVVDGVYAITFKIYSDSTGGSALWFETQPVPVTGGLFVAQLGRSTALPSNLFASDAEYYLGITVNLEPELPRVPLTSVAYSYQAKDADVATLAMNLTCARCVTAGEIAADAVGSSEIAAGAVIGGKGGDIADHTIDAADLASSSVGNSEIADGAVTSSKIAPDAVTEIQIAADAVGNSEIATGAVTAAEIGTGAVGSDEIATAAVGAAEIATGAVASSEVLDGSLTAADIDDEPGVASNTNPASMVQLTGAGQSFISRSIVAPAAGYVLVIASAQVLIFHDNGITSSANFGVTSTAGAFPDNQDILVRLDAHYPDGNFNQVMTFHGLFDTPGGSDTFYLMGSLIGGEFYLGNMQLTLIYFPTAHGTVVSTSAAGSESVPEE